MESIELKEYSEEGFFLNVPYLAGLLDSDGNIFLAYRRSTADFYPVIRLSIAQKFPNLLFSLKNLLKMGSVFKINKESCWLWEITGNQAINLLKIISPYLVIKYQQSHLILKFVQEKIQDFEEQRKRQKIISESRHKNPNVKNINLDWFCGFFDGDGCVAVYKNNKANTPRIRLEITIDGKDKEFSDTLAIWLEGKAYHRKNTKVQTNIGILDLNWLEEIRNKCNVKRSQFSEVIRWIMQCLFFNGAFKSQVQETEKFVSIIKNLKTIDRVPIVGELGANDYQKWTRTTAVYPKNKELEYLLLGLCSETGEICGKVKKIIRDKGSIFSKEDKIGIGDEISDVLWYIARLADHFECKLVDILEQNIEKLESRKKRGKISGSGDKR